MTTENFVSERLAELVNQQISRVTEKSVFTEEARYIAQTCYRNNIRNILDLGCWTGVLACDVLGTGIKLDNYHLVDAVPYYLDRACELFKDIPQVTHEAVTILPPSYLGDPPKEMLIHPYDTLNTSSLYSEHFLSSRVKHTCLHVPLAESSSITQYVTDNLDRFGINTYVKIDLDGVDVELVAEIIKRGLQPGGLQFEIWNNVKDKYATLASILKTRGYMIPTAELTKHKNFSVGVSGNYWWAVGYDIIGTQYYSTYYNSDVGNEPVTTL